MVTAIELRDATREILRPIIGAWNAELQDSYLSVSNPEGTLFTIIHQECLRRWPDNQEMRNVVEGYLIQRLIDENQSNTLADVGGAINDLRAEVRHRPVRGFFSGWVPSAYANEPTAISNAAAYLALHPHGLQPVEVPEMQEASAYEQGTMDYMRAIAQLPEGQLPRVTIGQLQEQLELAGYETGRLGVDGRVNRTVSEGIDHMDGRATRAAREAAMIDLAGTGVHMSDAQLYYMLLAHNEREQEPGASRSV